MPLFEGLSFGGGEKIAIVIDVGTAYSKCGLAGETSPQCIIPSSVKHPTTQKVVKIHGDFNAKELYGLLVDFLHEIYFRHLLVNPKERRVVIVESVFTVTQFRETLVKVLFEHYEVPSVLLLAGHQVALLTLAIPSALVMDVGQKETIVLPVFHGMLLLKAWQALPLAADAIHNRLEAQLLEMATVNTDVAQEKPLASIYNSLPEDVLEDIKVRCCFVTRYDRAEQLDRVRQESGDSAQTPVPPSDVTYPLDGSKIVKINGRIRETACEVLFEQDGEEKSIATLILDALLMCPIDTRRVLAANLVVIGGTAMLPGFLHRLLCEVRALATGRPRYARTLAALTFKLHRPAAHLNCVAWLGGAIFGMPDVLVSRSLSKDSYLKNARLPDWCCPQADSVETEKTPVKK